jgi:hypothetical protein
MHLAGNVGGLRPTLQPSNEGNIMKDGLHHCAVQGRSRIDRRDHITRRTDQRTKSCVPQRRWIKHCAPVSLRMNAIDRLVFTPRDDGRIEFARRRFDERFS